MVVSLITALSIAALASGAAVVDRKAREREEMALTAYPPEGQFVTVGGCRVHAVVRGSGPDLVLIHGASGNSRDFTFGFMDKMAARYRVIAIDRPGLGHTDRVSAALDAAFSTTAESLAEQAALLVQAASALGADRPIVLGQSYGCGVALAWALNHPAQCAGVIGVAGVSMPWEGGLWPYYVVNGSRLGGAMVPPLITAFASRARVDESIAAIFAPNPVPPGYADHVGAELTIRRSSLRANARQVNHLKANLTDMAPHYPGLRLPVEFVHGEADMIVPLAVHAARAAPQIPGAVLTVLPGVGHMPHHTAPDVVAAAIDRVAARVALR